MKNEFLAHHRLQGLLKNTTPVLRPVQPEIILIKVPLDMPFMAWVWIALSHDFTCAMIIFKVPPIGTRPLLDITNFFGV
tara:strand:+ start:3479 stop:3715 length:237 start_codon:yes stop_codon:yes gene_type:complete